MAGKLNKCSRCGTPSDKNILINCESNGQPYYVCIPCLPYLIHGSH